MYETQAENALFCIVPDILYTTVDGIPLYLDIIQPDPLPEERMPVVIYIHGGGWMGGQRKGERNTFLAAHGFFTISIDYRLSNQAIYPAQIADAKAAVRWVRANAERYHLDPEHIGVWGHSSGAHLAALLGTSAHSAELEGNSAPQNFSSCVQAVVNMCGPTDLSQMGGWHDLPDSPDAKLLGGPVQECLDLVRLANPIAYVHPTVPPFLIFHGTHDQIVPFNQSELLYAALKEVGADVTFIPMQDEDHNLTVKGEESFALIYQKTLDFFVKHLKG